MLIRFFWTYVLGFLTLTIQGEHPERFINLAIARGVLLWDVTRADPETILARVTARSFKPLRHIARRAKVRVRIRAKGGLPFVMLRLRRRRMLVVGAFTFCLLLYLGSSMIWSVTVVGTKQVDPGQIRQIAAAVGLRAGNLRFLVNSRGVADTLMREIPGIAFAEIDFRGTQASIKIYERVSPPPSLGAGNVVANKAAVIEEMLVLEGSPQVKVGDVVCAGQVLISGTVVPPVPPDTDTAGAPAPPPPQPEPRYVVAQGIIRARVWYRCYAEVPREETVEESTGRVTIIVSIRMPNKEISIFGPPSIPYSSYDLVEKKWILPQWRSIILPVEFDTIRAEEIRPSSVRRSYREALKMATGQAETAMAAQLPAGAEVMDRQVKEVDPDMSHVGVQLTVEALEPIGVPQQFAPPKKEAGG